MPRVAVILPVRDGGSYLCTAVQSILDQTFGDLELLLVDDHSSDGAIEDLPLSDTRLQLLKSPGQGVSAAFNYGLERSQSPLVARMDADDVALPQRLTEQVDLLEQRASVGIVGGCVEIFSQDSLGEGNRHYQSWLNRQVSPEDIRRALFIESPVPNPTAMFRREVLDGLGGYADPPWPEDYDLFLRADAAGVLMAKPPCVVLRWREHPARLTRRDPRYDRAQFQRAKAYFLARGRLEVIRQSGRAIVIWGAGPTGKQFHDLLEEFQVATEGFIDVHPRRIGGTKRAKPVWSVDKAREKGIFVLAAVGARRARKEIRTFLVGHGLREGDDFLFVA